jgi:hypothetical protein
MTLLKQIREILPPRSDADYLCDRTRRNALWQYVHPYYSLRRRCRFIVLIFSFYLSWPNRYNLDPSETFMPNLIHHVYTSPLEDLSSRRLALLYMLMTIGLQVDVSQPVDTPRAHVYYNLARAAICQIPIMEYPDLDLMHTLVRLGF